MSGLTQLAASAGIKKRGDGQAFHLEEPVISVDWSPDGKYLAVAGTEGTVVVVDAETGGLHHRLAGHRLGAMRVAWSSDGSLIASSGQDGKIRLWDSRSGGLVCEMTVGTGWVEHLAWLPDTGTLLSTAGKKLHAWNKAGEMQFEFAWHESTVAALQTRGDGKGFATACYGKIRCFRARETQPYETLDWKASFISLGWSPTGRFITAGTQENTVQFYRLPSRGEEPLQMSGYPTKVKHLVWDNFGRLLATNCADSITIWNVSGKGPAGTIPLQLAGHPAAITALAFQQRGSVLASGCEAGVVMLWRPAQCPWPVRKPEPVTNHFHAVRFHAAVNQARWAPDESVVAVGCQDGTVKFLRPPELSKA